MNLLHEQLARAQCQADQQEAERARVARALRANRRLQRAALAARRAEHRVTLRYARDQRSWAFPPSTPRRVGETPMIIR